jgi:hypothetical protein
MYEQNLATILTCLTMKLLGTIDCLSKAAYLISGGVSIFDSEVHGWMIGATS